MNTKSKIGIFNGIVGIILFIVWTLLVVFCDVSAIGPNDSSVGLSTLNGAFHELTGFSEKMFKMTQLTNYVGFALVAVFAVLGLIQLIQRKSLFKVDKDLYILAAFYIAVFAVFFLFEVVTINYRPEIINGELQGSYPSSSTLRVVCFTVTAAMQFYTRIDKKWLRNLVTILLSVFTVFAVIGRTICGCHWLSDIIGSLFISYGLIMLYYGFVNMISEEKAI